MLVGAPQFCGGDAGGAPQFWRGHWGIWLQSDPCVMAGMPLASEGGGVTLCWGWRSGSGVLEQGQVGEQLDRRGQAGEGGWACTLWKDVHEHVTLYL